MKEVKVPPPTPPCCMSIVDRLCSTLAENFNSTYLCRLKKFLVHYLSINPLFDRTQYAKEYFLLDIKDGIFPFFSNRFDLGAGTAKARRCTQPSCPANTFPLCQMRTHSSSHISLPCQIRIFSLCQQRICSSSV